MPKLHINNAILLQFVFVVTIAGAAAASAQQSYPTSALPVDCAAGDLTGDGNCDIITADWTGGAMTLFKGAGNGNLTPLQSIQAFGDTPSSVKLADVDLDARLDIVLGTWSGTVRLYKNDGSGSFTTLPTIVEPSSVNEAQVADVNLDGNPDVVTAHNFTSNVAAALGLGGGLFGAPIVSPGPPAAVTVAVGPLNHDGYPDLVIGGFNGNSLTLSLGNGTGAFLGWFTYFTNGLAPHVVELEDFDIDGDPDALVTWGNAFGVQLWQSSGSASLSPWTQLSVAFYPGRATGADLNKDGIVDVATSSSGQLYRFYGLGGGNSFQAPSIINLGSAGAGGCRLADVGHNGVLDFALIDGSVDLLWIALDSGGAPPGTYFYGTGTPGCKGKVGINANQIPYVGNLNFAMSFSNVPVRTLGLGLAGDAPDFTGFDYFAIGAILHFDFFTSTDVQIFNVYTDGGGAGYAPAPIPNNPLLAGLTYYACAVFLEDRAAGQACSPSYLNLDSSRGLSILIQ